MIYKAFGSNDYTVFVATADFPEGAPFHLTVAQSEIYASGGVGLDSNLSDSKVRKTQEVVTSWEQLENKECISTYGAKFLTGRRDLVVFTDTPNLNNFYPGSDGSLLAYDVVQMNALTQDDLGKDPLHWMYTHIDLDYNTAHYPKWTPNLIDPSNWTVYDQEIQHCRSERVEEHCRLYFNRIVGVVVISCNVIKFCCMVIAASKLQQDELCTIGYVDRHSTRRLAYLAAVMS